MCKTSTRPLVAKRIVRGALLTLAACIFVLHGLALAQDEENEENLDEILKEEFALIQDEAQTVESSARHEQHLGLSPSAVTVVTRKDIEASGAVHLVDILRLVPGMDVIQATPALSALALRSIWSHKNSYVLVLIDGRDTTVEIMGMPFLEMLPVSLSDIERIEVIKGPASSLYGANAFSGVVSIVSRGISQKTSSRAYVGGGEEGATVLAGKFSTCIKNFGFALAAERTTFHDFMDKGLSGLNSLRLRGVGEWRLAENRKLSLDVNYAHGRGPIPTNIGTFDGELGVTTAKAAYQSPEVKGHLYWSYLQPRPHFDIPIIYGGTMLARINDTYANGQVIDGEVQWQLPNLWQPLLIIVGGGTRYTTVSSNKLLDALSYSDPASPGYHLPGVTTGEARAGGFLHAEFTPAESFTLTAGSRVDYNQQSGWFVSPKLAGVYRALKNHFFRLGASRAFRKPSYMETMLHPDVVFPPYSPITGGDQVLFREFMTRVVGNLDLDNEVLWAFDAGYLGYFWKERLRLRLDLYYNMWSGYITIYPEIFINERGLPDLRKSSFMFQNSPGRLDSYGSELEIALEITPEFLASAWWAWREVVVRNNPFWDVTGWSPKNMLGLGARYWSEKGPRGSLYLFSRSDFIDVAVDNPEGLMAPLIHQKIEPVLLLMGRLGWRLDFPGGVQLEAGMKYLQPFSPWQAPHFCYREKGGVVDNMGRNFSGELICRTVIFYLEGIVE